MRVMHSLTLVIGLVYKWIIITVIGMFVSMISACVKLITSKFYDKTAIFQMQFHVGNNELVV